MNTPNWQHHSKKEAKRTLKPQALRQAKKRRAALKAKLLAASVVLVGAASPAQAVTWGEFWEPFTGDRHHHRVERHYYHPAPPPPRMCRRKQVVDTWVEPTPFYPGYWSQRIRWTWEPCHRHRHRYDH
jgi:hypothetical protein